MHKPTLGSLCIALLSGIHALAQTNAETNAGIQFNFSTPGAHSLALGGAYLALAEDATAAYTNPAGLIFLAEPELALELRRWTYSHSFTDRGRLEGEPTGRGVDSIRGIEEGVSENVVDGVSFLSYVHPFNKVVFAVYRHELANFEASFEAQGAFLSGRTQRLFPVRTELDTVIVNYGFSFAYEINEALSLGGSLSHYDFSIDSVTRRFLVPTFGEPDFSDQKERSRQVQSGSDTNWGATVGFVWKLTDSWSLGGVYRQGREFDFDAGTKAGPAATTSFVESETAATFQVPDSYGLGFAWKPTGAVRLSFDYFRIEYSDLTDDLADIFDFMRFGADPELDKFESDDVGELRLGVELFLLRARSAITLRLGSWLEPEHKIRFAGEAESFRALFRPGSDELHYSAGAGLSFRRVQLDLAFDYSERMQTFSLSVATRF